MSTSIVKCRTQAQITPLGIDCETPMFSWQMAASRTGAKQSAYRIIVSKDKTMTPIIWDSNIVYNSLQYYCPIIWDSNIVELYTAHRVNG